MARCKHLVEGGAGFEPCSLLLCLQTRFLSAFRPCEPGHQAGYFDAKFVVCGCSKSPYRNI